MSKRVICGVMVDDSEEIQQLVDELEKQKEETKHWKELALDSLNELEQLKDKLYG